MDDRALVRILHCGTHLGEQLEALGDAELVVIAIRINGDALDQLHSSVPAGISSGDDFDVVDL